MERPFKVPFGAEDTGSIKGGGEGLIIHLLDAMWLMPREPFKSWSDFGSRHKFNFARSRIPWWNTISEFQSQLKANKLWPQDVETSVTT